MSGYPPGNRAADAITGLNSRDPAEQPLSSMGDTREADPQFFREDVFGGPDDEFSHKVIVGGPKGVAVTTLYKNGLFSVTDERGLVHYSADTRVA